MPISVDGMTPLIQVFDMPTSLGFYRDMLGFEVVSDSGDGDESSWVWLRLGGADLMLGNQYEPGSRPDRGPVERSTWHADTCLYFGCTDPDEIYHELVAKGLNLEPLVLPSYGMKQLYVSDPDNYSLCFQCPVADR